MTEPELGAVVVGTGFGCITHVRALRGAGFDVKAIVGRDRERTEERARQFGVPRALTALDDALVIAGVDAVTVATRVAGTAGTAWIEGIGSLVRVADRDGTREIAVGSDLPTGRPEPLPAGVLHSAYDRMIAHGLDLGPYTCLAAAFRDRILAKTDPRREITTDPTPATFADGVAGMAVLDAARYSAREHGAWVDVDPRAA